MTEPSQKMMQRTMLNPGQDKDLFFLSRKFLGAVEEVIGERNVEAYSDKYLVSEESRTLGAEALAVHDGGTIGVRAEFPEATHGPFVVTARFTNSFPDSVTLHVIAGDIDSDSMVFRSGMVVVLSLPEQLRDFFGDGHRWETETPPRHVKEFVASWNSVLAR